jgi:hypothetical protein
MPEHLYKQNAVEYLEEFSDELELGFIDSMPIDEIRWQLHKSVGGVRKFHDKIASLLSIQKLTEGTKDIVRWISPTWRPKWAGQQVTSASVPKQSKSFAMDNGEFQIHCKWKNQINNQPALMEISWKAKVSMPCEFWVQFVDPDTQKILSTLKLGTELAGKKVFTGDVVGFNFTRDMWALSVLFKDV